jgi:hypothetical protein
MVNACADVRAADRRADIKVISREPRRFVEGAPIGP